MKWINAKERPPTKEDSPILAFREHGCADLNFAALQWLDDRDGWNGAGWYDHSEEYGFDQEDITHWMPLPKHPTEN